MNRISNLLLIALSLIAFSSVQASERIQQLCKGSAVLPNKETVSVMYYEQAEGQNIISVKIFFNERPDAVATLSTLGNSEDGTAASIELKNPENNRGQEVVIASQDSQSLGVMLVRAGKKGFLSYSNDDNEILTLTPVVCENNHEM